MQNVTKTNPMLETDWAGTPVEDLRGHAAWRTLRGGRLIRWKGKIASCAPSAVAAVGRICIRSFGLALLLGLTVGQAAAADDHYWDFNGTLVGYGGSGNWNLTSPLWSPSDDGVSGPYAAWGNSALDNAIFGGTAGTVTLGGPITAHDLTFNTNGYVLTGGTLNLAGATPTITVNSGTATMNSVIAGSSGLTKAGGGTLVLNGINTFTGGINLDLGTINAGSDAALGAVSNNIFTGAGATVALSIAGAGTNRTVTIGNGGRLNLYGSGAGSALITGNGQVSVGVGLTMSNDASTYTGRTTFNSVNGVAYSYFTSIGNLGEASSLGAPTTVSDGTIIFAQSSQYSDNVIYLGDGDSSNRNWELYGAAAVIRNRGTGTLSITGDVSTNGGGVFSAEDADMDLLGTLSGAIYNFSGNAGRTITLGGSNTYTGTTSIDTVTVRAAVLADAGAASSFGAGNTAISIVNDGAMSYTGTGGSSNRQWVIASGSILNDGGGALALSGAVDFGAGAGNSLALGGSSAGVNTLSGVVSGTGDLISDGSGTWVLEGANTRTGAIVVDGGTLRAGNASAFGTITGVTVNGGTLDLGGFDLTAPTLQGSGGAIALGAGTLTVDTTDDTGYAGGITGNGGLVKAGVGTLTLSGANTYTGDTSLNGGGLALDFSAAGAPASDIIAAASTLNMAGGQLTITGADGAPSSQGFDGLNITAGSNRVAATSGAGGTMTVDFGTITRTGGLVDFALPASGGFTTTSASLGGWATVNGTDYAKVDGGNVVAFTAADYSDKDDAANWLTGEVISDVGGAADTAFFGTVTGSPVLGGLKYTAAADSVVTIAADQTLGIDGTIIVASSVGTANQTITDGSLTGGAGGGTLGVLQNGDARFTIGSTIVDNGGATGFTKGGEGIVRLSGVNTYTGVTTLSGGELQIASLADAGSASSIGAASADASNLVLESGMLHYVGGTDDSTNRGFTLVNGGASAPTITVDAGRAIEFSGLVTSPDDAGLTKTGWGTLVLSNTANDYVGVTTIKGGGGSSNSTISVNTLADGGVASGIGAASSDSGNLVLSDGGRLHYTGGTVGINRGFTLASGSGGFGVMQAATTLTVGGTAVGTGRFVKDGAGTLILSGTNTYTGGTVVNAGTLVAGSVTAFGGEADGTDAGRLTVNTGATVDLADNSVFVGGLSGAGSVLLGDATLNINSGATFSGTISGTGGISVTRYTQTMTGCNNTYTGVTSISSTVSVDCLSDGGQASGIGAASSDPANLLIDGTLSYTGGSVTIDRGFTTTGGQIAVTDAGATLEFTGATTGDGFIKDGAGTLVLSGATTRNGTTQIDNGTLRAGTIDAFGSGRINFANAAGATVDLAGFDTTLGYLTGGGPLGGNITLATATLTLDWSGGAATYAGTISGTGGLVKNGGIVQTLTGCDSSYTGTTVINGGGLTVSCLTDGGANSSIGASTADASNLVINGGTLSYIGAGASTDRQFTLGASGGNALDASGTGALNLTSDAPITFSGTDTAQTLTLTGTNTDDNVLAAEMTNNSTGETSLSKSGTGTWILTNPDSSYTGKTIISGGVLAVDKLADGGLASSLGASTADASNLVIGNNSTLRYTGTGDTTNRLFTLAAGTTFIESSGTGAVVFTDTGPVTLADNNQNRTIALGGTNAGDNTLAGSIGDAGTGLTILAKNGSGTWVLTGTNTYTGTTVINGGTLKVGGGGTTGSIVSDTINLGSLVFDRSDSYAYDGVISGAGSVEQAGSGTTTLTADSTYGGGTTISDGTLQLGDGGASGSIVGDVVDDGLLAFDRSDSYTFGGQVSGSGELSQTGSGTTTLTAANTYAGGTQIDAGTLSISSDANLGDAAGAVSIGNGTLQTTANLTSNRTVTLDGAATLLTDAGTTFTVNGVVGGTGGLTKAGAGTTILTADNAYGGGTTITAGTLQLGSGGATGSMVGDIANDGTLVIDRSNALTLGGLISGSGGVRQIGAGTTTFSDDNSYTGTTQVNAGILLVNGDQSAATGLTSVASGATLGGFGVIGGNVGIADGGRLAPGNSPGTLTINGDLTLASGSILDYQFGEADVAGGSLNDLVNVGGDLTLDGTINVAMSSGGSFGGGIYRVFSYNGTLTDNDLSLGTLPSGSNVVVQTAISGQVNLVNTAGLSLNFWDGDAGPKFDGVVDGGNGTWQASGGNNNWTNVGGTINAGFDDGSFAVFGGTGGTVTVDSGVGTVEASSLQFASDGYTITGNALTLLGPQSGIRVGDGTAAGASTTATIASALLGSTKLVKTDLGTLVLSGNNSYSGGTDIDAGTLSISSDANLGDAAGAISIDGATLRTTANLASNRTVTLGGADTLLTDAGTTFTLNGAVGGTGSLAKEGAGTLVLGGTNSYAGDTTISAGILGISSDTNLGDAAGAVGIDDATLWTTADATSGRAITLDGTGTLLTDAGTTFTLEGTVGGTGALRKAGAGTLVLAHTNSYAGGTTISSGTLQIGNGGTAGSITGDVANDGALAFNRSNSYTFGGAVSGTGTLVQIGTGTTILTADNSYAGATTVNAGSLYVDGDQSMATGLATVNANGTLGGAGTIGGDVVVASGGALDPGATGATGTLTINGKLSFDGGSTLNYSFGQANVAGGPLNDLVNVGDDLSLDGTLNVQTTPGANFDPGIYRVINYAGTLTDNGLSIGTIPSPDFYLQTSVDHQVNLVNTAGMTLRYWDGEASASKNNATVDGGNGTWQDFSGNDNWTEQTGAANAPFNDAAFAVFMGAAGTVSVDDNLGAIHVSGMQFATDGYLVQGDAIELVGAPSSTIRVGDGTMAGAGMRATIAAALTGSSQLAKGDLGTLVLTGTNTYTGGTVINAGTLQLGDGGTSGSIAGNVTTQGVLAIDRSDAVTLASVISGNGGITQRGGGTTTLTGANSYTGATLVDTGTLIVNGDQSAATGQTNVASGATLGGSGVIGGDVTLANGATLAPGNSPGTLTINGNLALDGGSILDYQFGQADVAGGTLNDLVNVGGDLALDGTLNVTVPTGGSFGPGVYRVFNYAGALIDNTLALGTLPSGNVSVQTAIAGQVNLVNATGVTLNFWDGDAGPAQDGVVNGGDGDWQSSGGNHDWTNAGGTINAGYDDGGFAIFAGTGGTVTVDNSVTTVTASGMQFSSDGYTIRGDVLALAGPQSIIRVGDGSTAGSGMTATIESVLTGNTQLVKTDAGTLVLTGTNTYTGGTVIDGGTLQVAADTALGDAAGGLSFDGGTLQTTADMSSDRAITLTGEGTVLTDAGIRLTLGGTLAGAGALHKTGEGTLVLDADSGAYGGAASVDAGTLVMGGVLGGSLAVGGQARLEGTGRVGATDNHGLVAPGSDDAFGTLTIDGDYAGDGGRLLIAAALGDDESAGSRLAVTGDTSGSTQVDVVNRGGFGARATQGIKIVDVTGASQGTFTLNGDYVFEGEQAVVAGAYGYRLYQGGVATPGDGDWYLRSALRDPGQPDQPDQPLYQPGVPIYESYAGSLQTFNKLGTLQQRIGNRLWTARADDAAAGAGSEGNGGLIRIVATHAKLSPDVSTSGSTYDADTWKLQAGADGLLLEDGSGSLVGGVFAQYGTISSNVRSRFGAGDIDTTAYGLNGTLTWYGGNGFYADGQAQLTRYDSDLHSATARRELANGVDGTGYGFSIEAGQRFAFAGHWSVTPQGQLGYSRVRFDDFTDAFGADVSLDRSRSLLGRLGIAANYDADWLDSNGKANRTHLYGIVNLYHEFAGRSEVDVSATGFSSRNDRMSGGIGAGGSLDWASGKYSLYGEVQLRSSLKNIGENNVITGTVGFRARL